MRNMLSKLNILSVGVVVLACAVQSAIGVPTTPHANAYANALAFPLSNQPAPVPVVALGNLADRLSGRAPSAPEEQEQEEKRQVRPLYQNAGIGMGSTGGFGGNSGTGTWEAGAKEPEVSASPSAVPSASASGHGDHTHGGKEEEEFVQENNTASEGEGRFTFTVPANATSAPSNLPYPSPAPSIHPSQAPSPSPSLQTSGAKAKFYTPKFAWPAAFAILCVAHASSLTRTITEKVQEKVDAQKRKGEYQKVRI